MFNYFGDTINTCMDDKMYFNGWMKYNFICKFVAIISQFN